jgi:hypothetical protein
MTEPEILDAIKAKAQEKANELLSEALTLQAQTFELDPHEPVDAASDRMLMALFDQLDSFKGMF